VVRALLADRAQEQLGEAAVAARANEEQIRVARSATSTAADGPSTTRGSTSTSPASGITSHRVALSAAAARVAKLVQLTADPRQDALHTRNADVAELPGMDGAEFRVPQLGLLEREAERFLRSGRVVDTDDDHW
jgi:hypothetical protein